MRRHLVRAAVLLLTFAGPGDVLAQEVWRGDFEPGDTSQFDGELNGMVGGSDQITIVEAPVVEGRHAARIELVNDARWPNGLKRVELHHSPAPGRTAEGEELYFAWSFMLPETLPADPDQQIAYWETDGSYSQLMAFTVSGGNLRFSTNHPTWSEHFIGLGAAGGGRWHRIAMHVVWSREPGNGTVDLWVDGEMVLYGVHAATLVDSNPAFIQLGLLRGAVEFTDAPVILLDDVVEGDSLESVRPGALTDEGDAGLADAGAIVVDAAVGGLDSAPSVRPDVGPRPDAGPSTIGGPCSCRAPGGERRHATPAALASVLVLLLGLRARARRVDAGMRRRRSHVEA